MALTTFDNGPTQRFEATARITYNGVAGIVWVERRLADGGWVHCGRRFAPLRASRRQIVEDTFDCVYRGAGNHPNRSKRAARPASLTD